MKKLLAIGIIATLFLFFILPNLVSAGVTYDGWTGYSTEGIHKVAPSPAEIANGVLYKYDSEGVMVYIAQHGVRYTVKTNTGNHWVQYEFRNPNDVSPVINITTKSATWDELYENVDISYTLLVDEGTRTSSGLKQEILVKAEPPKTYFDEKITVSSGVTYERIEDVFWFYYDDGNPSTDDRLFYITKPFIYIPNSKNNTIGESTHFELEIKKVVEGNSAYIRLDASGFLANNTIYPFVIDPATYSAATNTITVTGYTEAAPCTFLDIYNADVAGGWGKVTRQCTNQYCFQAKLTIGDGSTATWFADEGQQIIIPTGTITGGGWVVWCSKKANANIRLGKCTDSSKKITEQGCHIWITRDNNGALTILDGEDSSGNIEFYSSSVYFKNPGNQQARFYRSKDGKFWNDNFDGRIQIASATGLNIYNINFFNAHSGLPAVIGTFDLLRYYKTDYITNLDETVASDVTISNVIAKENTYVSRGYSSSKNLYMINFDVGTWAFTYSSYTGKFYRQYEFDLKVQDKDENAINGGTVKIWDLNNNLVTNTTTNATGKIVTQTLNYGYYNQAGGDTPTMQTPHTIQIYNASYQIYETNFTIDKKTNWTISLKEPCSVSPAITDWYNNLTNDNKTFVYINSSKCIYFNVTTNQTTDNFYWHKNENFLSDENYDNITTCWNNTEETGILKVYGSNANGTTNTAVWYVGENMSMLNESVSLLLGENKMIGLSLLLGVLIIVGIVFFLLGIILPHSVLTLLGAMTFFVTMALPIPVFSEYPYFGIALTSILLLFGLLGIIITFYQWFTTYNSDKGYHKWDDYFNNQ